MNIEGNHSYSGILDWLSGVDSENIKAGQAAEQKLRAIQAAKAASTKKPQPAIGSGSVVGDQSLYELQTNSATSVSGGFKEGLAEGATNIRQGVGGAINTTLGTTFSLIPWQVWLAVGIGAYLYFNPGILGKLRRA